MIIDCGTCMVRGDACADCVVTFLTIPVRPGAAPPGVSVVPAWTVPEPGAGALQTDAVELDDAERTAIGVLAASGLVPPLRMVRAV